MLNILKSYYYKFLFWKGELQISTPKKRAVFLNKKGIETASINQEHVKDIYSSLKVWKGSINDAAIAEMNKLFNKPQKEEAIVSENLLGVIVETRNHPDLAFVIHNFIDNTGFKVQLFHGTDNLDFILSTSIKALVDNGMVTLVELPLSALNEHYYNALFLNVNFWYSIQSRGKVLVFQTDSVVCSQSPFELSDFLHFDYIGAKWCNRLRPNGLVLDGGVGGFSLRDCQMSIDSLLRFPGDNWQGGEDDYFAFHIELIGGKVGNKKDCAKFCTQNSFLEKSFGAHQISNLNKVEQAKFLEYCPESKFLLNQKA
jgi:hypothetical protein